MQRAQGAPGAMVPVVTVGLLPMAGRALGSTGTSVGIVGMNFPSPSKTWMRRLPRGAAQMLLCGFAGGTCGGLRRAGWSAGHPRGVMHVPALLDSFVVQ